MFSFLKQIFTWWHKQTIGTFIYTLVVGKYVGSDVFGNKYYSSTKGKRWVVYNGGVESSKIPPEWHLWIHYLKKNKPDPDKKNFSWQKQHEHNLTGTKKAHKPEGSLSSNSQKITKKYETRKY